MIFNESKFNEQWQIKSLDQLGIFQRGKSRHRPRNDKLLFTKGKHPLIQTGEVKEANLYVRNHSIAYNDFGLSQSKLWPENTLCITIAANIAETALLGYPMCFPDSVVGFRAFPKKSSELFMHYVFAYIRNAIQDSAIGSSQANINIEYLTAIEFRTPKKPHQDNIAAVLSSLDKKIETNNRIVTELEAIAMAYFNYWFVQFDFPNEHARPYRENGGAMEFNEQLNKKIPNGWEVKKLSEITNVSTGSIDPMNTPEKEFKLYSIPVFDTTKCFGIEQGVNIKSNKFVVEEADLLISKLNPWFNRVVYSLGEKDQICSTEFVVWRTPNKPIKNFLYFLARNERFINYCAQSATGTSNSHKRVNPTIMMNFKVPYDESRCKAFGVKVNNLIAMSMCKQKENQQLQKLRNWLLPMLFTGQVKVKSSS